MPLEKLKTEFRGSIWKQQQVWPAGELLAAPPEVRKLHPNNQAEDRRPAQTSPCCCQRRKTRFWPQKGRVPSGFVSSAVDVNHISLTRKHKFTTRFFRACSLQMWHLKVCVYLVVVDFLRVNFYNLIISPASCAWSRLLHYYVRTTITVRSHHLLLCVSAHALTLCPVLCTHMGMYFSILSL